MTAHDIISITKLVYKVFAVGFGIYHLAKGNTEKVILWSAVSIAL